MSLSDANCRGIRAPYYLSVTTAVLSTVLSAITVPGNLLICIAILKDPHKDLRTSFNYFVLNLAIADLIVGAITDPMSAVFHVRESLGYPVQSWIWLLHLSYFISCTASLLSMGALAIERYVIVSSNYRRRFQPSRAILASVGILIISCILPIAYLAVGFNRFAFIFANTAIIITVAIICFTFTRIYHSLHANVLRFQTSNSQRMASAAIVLEKRISRGFIFIIVFFLCCSIPACILIYLINFCTTCSCTVIHWSRDLFYLLVVLNCSANQFLYAWRMPNFTKALRNLPVICGLTEPVRPNFHTRSFTDSQVN
jgi:hypothetical protein